MIGISFVFIVLVFCFSRLINSKRIALVTLIVVSSVVLICWNIVYQPTPTSDYKVIWNGAHQIIDGSFHERTIDKSDYFVFYSFQIPYTYYISLLLRIYDSIATLIIAETIAIVITDVLVYKILCIYCEVKSAFFGSMLFSVFPYIVIGSGIINNHHVGTLFGVLAIYMILRMNTIIKYILAACSLVIGNLLRPTIIMIFIAIAFVLVLQGFIDKKKWIGFLLFLTVYIGLYELFNLSLIGLSIAPYGIKGGSIYFKLLLGLTGSGVTNTPTTDAEHTNLFYDLQFYNFDYEKYKEASKEYLLTKISKGDLDYSFISNKIIHFISGIDNQYVYVGNSFNDNHKKIMEYLNFSGLIIYLLTLLGGFINTLRQKDIVKNSPFFIPAIIFCAFFGVYCFIEVQTRYRYELYICLFLISIPAIYDILAKMAWLINSKYSFYKREKT